MNPQASIALLVVAALLASCRSTIEPGTIRVEGGGPCLIEKVPELETRESVLLLADVGAEKPAYLALQAAHREDQPPIYYDLRMMRRVSGPVPVARFEELRIFDNALPFPIKDTYREARQELRQFLNRERFHLASENLLNVNWMGNRTHVAIHSVSPALIDSFDLSGHVFGHRWPKHGDWHVEVFSVPGYRRSLYVHGPLNGEESNRWILRWVHSSHLAMLVPSNNRHILCLCPVGN